MKKFVSILAVIVVLLFCLSLQASADWDETAEMETVETAETLDEASETGEELESVMETEGEIPEPASEPVLTNIVKQFWDWVVENKVTIITSVLNAITLGVVWVFKKFNDRISTSVKAQIASIKDTTDDTNTAQNQVVGAVNGMIDEYNKLREQTISLEKELERQKQEAEKNTETMAALLVSTTTVMEMLQSAYSNSKSLPQPVKDMITYKYVRAIKEIDGNELAKEATDQVKKETV